MGRRLISGLVVAMSAGMSIGTASAANIGYTLGNTHTEDFDTLPTGASEAVVAAGWTNDSTLPAWYSNQTTLFRVGAGGSNAGALYSYGTLSTTERALGSAGGGSGAAGTGTPFNGVTWAVAFVNNNAFPLTSFTLEYDGEQWRNGGNATAQTAAFSYQVLPAAADIGAEIIDNTDWISETSLDFTGPITGTTATALDGNAAANRIADISDTISGFVWQPGELLVLRWSDPNHAGNDHGLSIDNLSFSAVPSPGAGALLGAGLVMTARRRRR